MSTAIILQLDSDAGLPAWSPAVQLQEQVGEGEVDLEMETCLPFLSNHPGVLQGRLTEDKYLLAFFVLPQATLLLHQSPAMVGMNIRVTACEGIWESLLQLCLQLFVIFSRSDTIPSFLQVGWYGTYMKRDISD